MTIPTHRDIITKTTLKIAALNAREYEDVHTSYDVFEAAKNDWYIKKCLECATELCSLYENFYDPLLDSAYTRGQDNVNESFYM